MKKVWITALAQELEQKVGGVIGALDTYGLMADGRFWLDDLENQVWIEPRDILLDPDVKVWLILATEAELAKPSVRLGLSLLCISVQAARGNGFPVVLACEGTLPADKDLPTPLRSADILRLDDPTLGSRMVAKANIPPPKVEPAYRLKVYAMRQLGLWFEVGPRAGEPWAGALFGVAGTEVAVDSHGVGEAGKLPDKAVLQYPMRDMKLELGEEVFQAWGVRNTFDPNDSYFARVHGDPDSIVFGALGDSDAPELYILRLV